MLEKQHKMRYCVTCGGPLMLANDRCLHCGGSLSPAEQSALKADYRRWWLVTGGLALSSAILALSMCSGRFAMT